LKPENILYDKRKRIRTREQIYQKELDKGKAENRKEDAAKAANAAKRKTPPTERRKAAANTAKRKTHATKIFQEKEKRARLDEEAKGFAHDGAGDDDDDDDDEDFSPVLDADGEMTAEQRAKLEANQAEKVRAAYAKNSKKSPFELFQESLKTNGKVFPELVFSKKDHGLLNEAEEAMEKAIKTDLEALNPKSHKRPGLMAEDVRQYHHRFAQEWITEFMLGKIVGQETVKKVVRDMLIMVRGGGQSVEDRFTSANSAMMHLAFLGKSGSGKTSTSIKVAVLYYFHGIVTEAKITLVKAPDFIAQYRGQTEKKVDDLMREAGHGVIIVDETQILAPNKHDPEPGYSKDAIVTFMTFMERAHWGKIFFCGYLEGTLRCLIEWDPGLARRVYTYMHCPNLGPEQIAEVLLQMVAKTNFTLEMEVNDLAELLKARYSEEAMGKLNAGISIQALTALQMHRASESDKRFRQLSMAEWLALCQTEREKAKAGTLGVYSAEETRVALSSDNEQVPNLVDAYAKMEAEEKTKAAAAVEEVREANDAPATFPSSWPTLPPSFRPSQAKFRVPPGGAAAEATNECLGLFAKANTSLVPPSANALVDMDVDVQSHPSDAP
jgi:hypothetical protein